MYIIARLVNAVFIYLLELIEDVDHPADHVSLLQADFPDIKPKPAMT